MHRVGQSKQEKLGTIDEGGPEEDEEKHEKEGEKEDGEEKEDEWIMRTARKMRRWRTRWSRRRRTIGKNKDGEDEFGEKQAIHRACSTMLGGLQVLGMHGVSNILYHINHSTCERVCQEKYTYQKTMKQTHNKDACHQAPACGNNCTSHCKLNGQI